MKLNRFSSTGTKTTMTAPETVFAVPQNEALLSQAVRVYLSNRRQGTSKVQTRSEVSLTKSKWYKQKGTGNARHGAKSAPIFVGGGVAHGPKGLTNWTLKLPSVLKVKALAQAFTAQAEACVVVDGIETLSGKTKDAAKLIEMVGSKSKSILVVVDSASPETLRSFSNIKQVTVISARQVTALDVAASNMIVLSPEAVLKLEKRVAGKKVVVSEKTIKAAKKEVAKKSVADKKPVVKKSTTKKSK